MHVFDQDWDTMFALTGDRLNEQTKEFIDGLIQERLMLKCSDLLKMDCIDLRGALHYASGCRDFELPITPRDNIDYDFLSEHSWYALIPCFEEGSLRINDKRYLYFKITELDADNQRLSLDIKDYFRSGEAGYIYSGRWQVGVQTSLHFEFSNIEEEIKEIEQAHSEVGAVMRLKNGANADTANDRIGTFAIIRFLLDHSWHDNDIDYDDLYQMLDYDKLGWDKAKQDFWNDSVVDFAREKRLQIKQEDGHSTIDDLILAFVNCIIYANQIIASNKSHTKRIAASGGTRRSVAATSDAAPQKRIRNIGPIQVRSEKVPHIATRETLIRYKVASWKARGGVRKLKSGRLVPFKACVKHRKCLTKNANEPSETLKLHN